MPNVHFNLFGLLLTAALSFVLVWSIQLLRTTAWTSGSWLRIGSAIFVTPAIVFVLYTYLRQQRLQNLRMQAVGSASSYTESAHSFDAVALAAITLIQEVEVVSRGYHMYVYFLFQSAQSTHVAQEAIRYPL